MIALSRDAESANAGENTEAAAFVSRLGGDPARQADAVSQVAGVQFSGSSSLRRNQTTASRSMGVVVPPN